MMSYTATNIGGQQREDEPKVVCVWCGGVIRGGASKTTKRMCQPCFALMMREHSRAHQPQSTLPYASER